MQLPYSPRQYKMFQIKEYCYLLAEKRACASMIPLLTKAQLKTFLLPK